MLRIRDVVATIYHRRMADLETFRELLSHEHGLVVVTTLRRDLTMQSSVVNAGVMAHPISGADTVALVAVGRSAKLANLRERPQASITARVGWQWATVEGTAELFGPADPSAHFAADGLRRLLRDVFAAAGGTHDDWNEYDRVMAAEGRTAVFVTPTRVYSNR
jgi:PPOX class probable F420-dependent enzyme